MKKQSGVHKLILALLFILAVALFTSIAIKAYADPLHMHDKIVMYGTDLPYGKANQIEFHPNPSNHYSGLRFWGERYYQDRLQQIGSFTCHDLAKEKNGVRAVHEHCSLYTNNGAGGMRSRLNVTAYEEIADMRIHHSNLILNTESKLIISSDDNKYYRLRVRVGGEVYSERFYGK